MSSTAATKILELSDAQGLVRSSDMEKLGATRATIARLVAKGELQKVARGVYMKANRVPSDLDNLLEVSIKVPKSVFCLLTALSLHEITTEMPHEAWIGLEYGGKKPLFDFPPLRVIKYSGPSFEFGVETKEISGVSVRLFSVAKTVADCFKYRNKIGLDVAMEALKDGWRKKRFTIDELNEAAKANRVRNVMRPYIEAMLV
jgi:predicted transcriptional regulator of viral defense system